MKNPFLARPKILANSFTWILIISIYNYSTCIKVIILKAKLDCWSKLFSLEIISNELLLDIAGSTWYYSHQKLRHLITDKPYVKKFTHYSLASLTWPNCPLMGRGSPSGTGKLYGTSWSGGMTRPLTASRSIGSAWSRLSNGSLMQPKLIELVLLLLLHDEQSVSNYWYANFKWIAFI